MIKAQEKIKEMNMINENFSSETNNKFLIGQELEMKTIKKTGEEEWIPIKIEKIRDNYAGKISYDVISIINDEKIYKFIDESDLKIKETNVNEIEVKKTCFSI